MPSSCVSSSVVSGAADELVRGVVRSRTISPDDWNALARLIAEHGVLDSAYMKAVEYATVAKECLHVFPPSRERDALMALPDYVLSRDR